MPSTTSSEVFTPGARMSVGSISTWDLLGALSQFRHNVERYRWYVSSISTVRFLSILNVTYTLIGLTFLILAHIPSHELHFQQKQFLYLGIGISLFSPLALMSDILALQGLRTWKRLLVLPWLFVYGVILTLAFGILVLDVYNRLIRWHHLLLMICVVIVFSRWRHISIQYRLMGLYSEKPSQRAINEQAFEIGEAAATSRESNNKDRAPPPKYEDLEQPPQYDEDTMQDVKLKEAIAASVVMMTAEEEEIKGKISEIQNKIKGGEALPDDVVKLQDLNERLSAMKGLNNTVQ